MERWDFLCGKPIYPPWGSSEYYADECTVNPAQESAHTIVSDKTGSRGGDQGLKIVEIIAVFWNQMVSWKESGKVAIAIS